MKTFLAVASLGVFFLLGSLVVAQVVAQNDRQAPLPPGISQMDWIPIGENFGFVVSPSALGRNSEMLTGYFVARQGSTWKKVDSEGGFRFQPLQK